MSIVLLGSIRMSMAPHIVEWSSIVVLTRLNYYLSTTDFVDAISLYQDVYRIAG